MAKEVIAIAWMTIEKGTDEVPARMRLFKILRERENAWWRYEVEPINRTKYLEGFRWAEIRWPCFGVWHHGHPGLVWTPDLDEVGRAFAAMAEDERVWLVETPELERAPVRYEPQEVSGWYPYVRSTRSRSDLWRLRRLYPTASELSYIPLEVLIRTHGQGLAVEGVR